MREYPRQLTLFTEVSPVDDSRSVWQETKKGKTIPVISGRSFSRVVRDFRPRWVVVENVPGILSIAADTVCADLECQGYEVGICDFEAAAVGAKHRRERIFFVAHAGRALRQRISEARDVRETDEERNALATERPSSTHVADINDERCEEQAFSKTEWCCGRLSQSELGRGINGFSAGLDCNISPIATDIPNRTKRLNALGNAVVPQQIYPIF